MTKRNTSAASAASARVRSRQREEGLAFARRWRIQNKPYFDDLYGSSE